MLIPKKKTIVIDIISKARHPDATTVREGVRDRSNQGEPPRPDTLEALNNPFEDWTAAELLESIKQSNNWLHRLSNSIKTASIVNQNVRAAEFRLEDFNGGNNRLTEDYVRTIFTNAILDINNNLDEKWLHRLIDSMITRLKRILYRRSRQAQWSFSAIPNPIMDGTPKPLKAQNRLPSVLQQNDSTPALNSRIGHPKLHNGLPSRATELSPQVWKSNALKSEISRATSTPKRQEDETAIPSPPREAIRATTSLALTAV